MAAKLQQGVLAFKIEKNEEPLIARARLVLLYEMAGALRLPGDYRPGAVTDGLSKTFVRYVLA